MSRGIDESRDIGYPVHGRGVTMISARNRVVQITSGTSLQVRGGTVNQGDYVIADRCGTVFIPAEHNKEVLGSATELIIANLECSKLFAPVALFP